VGNPDADHETRFARDRRRNQGEGNAHRDIDCAPAATRAVEFASAA